MPPKKQLRPEESHPSDSGDSSDGSSAAAAGSSSSLSLNPIFACTGPRAGLLSYASGRRALDGLLDVVDDTVFQALEDAWAGVGVPAADYWCARPRQPFAAAAAGHHTPLGIAEVPVSRAPDPRALAESFYGSRLSAMRSCGYMPSGGLVVVAVDRRLGNGSKLFSVLPRVAGDAMVAASGAAPASALADFVAAIPQPCDRSLYVLVDEQAAVDPYFDIDCTFAAPPSGRGGAAFATAFPWWAAPAADTVPAVTAAQVEQLLHSILAFIIACLEKHLATTVEECLVLTSSVQTSRSTGSGSPAAGAAALEVKLSFHVHLRLHRRQAFASVRELHLFMSRLREGLDAVLSLAPSADDAAFFAGVTPTVEGLAAAAAIVRRCVDFGVYTRWRAFRLPYSVKTPFATGAGMSADFTPLDAAGDDLLAAQLARTGVVAELPDVTVGAAANSVLQSILLPADPSLYTSHLRLVRKMLFLFRFLLPVVAGVTQLSYEPLKSLLERYAPRLPAPGPSPPTSNRQRFATAVMDMAAIQRDAAPVLSAAGEAECLQLLTWAAGGTAAAEACGDAAAEASPFAGAKPPRPYSARVPVNEAATMTLLAEVFACLAPQYGGIAGPAPADGPFGLAMSAVPDNQNITAERVSAMYEESIRAYYVMQKQNKYCLRVGRAHRSTYAQLYITYGSIKVRCYSNDCCERCLFIPWVHLEPAAATASTFSAGYPRYDRLAELRALLFPELPPDELVRRYGPGVLDEMRRQQQQHSAQLQAVLPAQQQPEVVPQAVAQ